ncbi:glycoside hydrolase domain-containing protein [Edaphobacter albus]|uniref:glycoside hydrolase domain-containing protein n=1 Tax=Edaphobacter sp. 4G125 TaxID=2763071 RepID=UPI001646D7B5|nr:glycoside hydrolase domain-containing protein [Edaphobacter sp. 4G125]QNI36396.1 DUF1906 domain-containing protein [Edaphobacter sp. 4G125]
MNSEKRRPVRHNLSILTLGLATLALAFSQQILAQNPRPSLGFDRNHYPGDAALPALKQHFSFTGYWLNNPPGETTNDWQGKREILHKNKFGFLVLFNGRLDAEIIRANRRKISPAKLGKQDAAAAILAARREHFPDGSIIFLDQEEGGRLLPEQAAYLLSWTEAIAASTYKPGIYLSGQPVEDDPGKTITTAQDVREQIAAKHLHSVALFVYQDACPPSNGCTLNPPPIAAAGTPNIDVWQYAQSPRRPKITHACAKTYAANNDCVIAGVVDLDLSVAISDDPSHGR